MDHLRSSLRACPSKYVISEQRAMMQQTLAVQTELDEWNIAPNDTPTLTEFKRWNITPTVTPTLTELDEWNITPSDTLHRQN